MSDKHEHLDEGTIHAWLDGALPPDESARVETLVAACTECAALVAEARGLVAASSRILSSLDAVPGGVIPGVERTDQLAALRARRRESSRRWWNDRRIVAASLVFVAGVSSLVWRSVSNDERLSSSQQEANAIQPLADSAMPVVTLPPSAPSEATVRDARVGAVAPLPNPAPPRAASARRPVDSVVDQKVAAANAPLSRRADGVANELRRADSSSVAAKSQAIDSISAQRAPQRSVAEVQLQQGGATQGQQALRQRTESRPAAPPPAFGAGARLGPVVTTGVAADMAASSRSCYRLREPRGDPGIIADSVQLLSETPMELSDPTWYRARAAGWADTALVWRSVDSTTVELRSRVVASPLVVRFSVAGLLPEPGREPGVRVALVSVMRCR